MSKGYVYILTNPAMPGLVKIGKTVRSVEGRASELYQTGVPVPFEVYGEALCPDCHALELRMHEEFADYRVSAGREFFRVDPEEASMKLHEMLECMVNEWVDEFMPDHAVGQADLILDKPSIWVLAGNLAAHPFEIVSAFEELTDEELAPALDRWREKVRIRTENRRSGLVLIEGSA